MGVVVGIIAFASEIALLAAAAVVGWAVGQDLGGAVVGGAGAVLLPLVIATAWGLWLAPRARRPLPRTPGLVAKCALFAVVGIALALTASPVWGAVLAVAGIGSALAARRFPFPGHP